MKNILTVNNSKTNWVVVYSTLSTFESDISILDKHTYLEVINNEEVYGLYQHSSYIAIGFNKLKQAKKFYRQHWDKYFDELISLSDIEIEEIEFRENPRKKIYYWVLFDRTRGEYLIEEGTPNDIDSKIYNKYERDVSRCHSTGFDTYEEALKFTSN